MDEKDKEKLIGRLITFWNHWDIKAEIIDVIGPLFKLKIIAALGDAQKHYKPYEVILFPYTTGHVFKFIDKVEED